MCLKLRVIRHKFTGLTYLHGSSCFKKGDDDWEWRFWMICGAASHSEHRDGVWLHGPAREYWCGVWEPRARGRSPNPRHLCLVVCMWRTAHRRSVCVRKLWRDLTLRALAQLNKLNVLPLTVCIKLIFQLRHIQTQILSAAWALQLSSTHRNSWFLYYKSTVNWGILSFSQAWVSRDVYRWFWIWDFLVTRRACWECAVWRISYVCSFKTPSSDIRPT